MDEQYTIYVCDECKARFEDEREIITCRVGKDPKQEYHVCYSCIGEFAEKMKDEV